MLLVSHWAFAVGWRKEDRVRAKKHLGQHFLKATHVVNHILDALEPAPGDHFLEIGPGPATLTRPLNDRGFGLTVVETDRDMVSYLSEQSFDPPVEIVAADFLDLELAPLFTAATKVVSNLPYNVSVPITAKLLTQSAQIPLMVLMYQKEVAERIRARSNTKDYGPISVLVRCFYDIDWKMNVAPGNFRPPPKVQSQVIRLRRLAEPLLPLSQLAQLTELVRYLFMHRRKMVGGLLKRSRFDWTHARVLLESLEQCGLSTQARAEDFSPKDYATWLATIKKESL